MPLKSSLKDIGNVFQFVFLSIFKFDDENN